MKGTLISVYFTLAKKEHNLLIIKKNYSKRIASAGYRPSSCRVRRKSLSSRRLCFQ